MSFSYIFIFNSISSHSINRMIDCSIAGVCNYAIEIAITNNDVTTILLLLFNCVFKTVDQTSNHAIHKK